MKYICQNKKKVGKEMFASSSLYSIEYRYIYLVLKVLLFVSSFKVCSCSCFYLIKYSLSQKRDKRIKVNTDNTQHALTIVNKKYF